jgi:hypothetical protein
MPSRERRTSPGLDGFAQLTLLTTSRRPPPAVAHAGRAHFLRRKVARADILRRPVPALASKRRSHGCLRAEKDLGCGARGLACACWQPGRCAISRCRRSEKPGSTVPIQAVATDTQVEPPARLDPMHVLGAPAKARPRSRRGRVQEVPAASYQGRGWPRYGRAEPLGQQDGIPGIKGDAELADLLAYLRALSATATSVAIWGLRPMGGGHDRQEVDSRSSS